MIGTAGISQDLLVCDWKPGLRPHFLLLKGPLHQRCLQFHGDVLPSGGISALFFCGTSP